jgi:hypothetical protein
MRVCWLFTSSYFQWILSSPSESKGLVKEEEWTRGVAAFRPISSLSFGQVWLLAFGTMDGKVYWDRLRQPWGHGRIQTIFAIGAVWYVRFGYHENAKYHIFLHPGRSWPRLAWNQFRTATIGLQEKQQKQHCKFVWASQQHSLHPACQAWGYRRHISPIPRWIATVSIVLIWHLWWNSWNWPTSYSSTKNQSLDHQSRPLVEKGYIAIIYHSGLGCNQTWASACMQKPKCDVWNVSVKSERYSRWAWPLPSNSSISDGQGFGWVDRVR